MGFLRNVCVREIVKTAAVKQCPGRQSGSAGAGNVWDWPNKLKCSLFWCL